MGTEPIEERESWLVGRQENKKDVSLVPVRKRMMENPDSFKELREVGPKGNPSLLAVKATKTVVESLLHELDPKDEKYRLEKNAPVQPSGNLG